MANHCSGISSGWLRCTRAKSWPAKGTVENYLQSTYTLVSVFDIVSPKLSQSERNKTVFICEYFVNYHLVPGLNNGALYTRTVIIVNVF